MHSFNTLPDFWRSVDNRARFSLLKILQKVYQEAFKS